MQVKPLFATEVIEVSNDLKFYYSLNRIVGSMLRYAWWVKDNWRAYPRAYLLPNNGDGEDGSRFRSQQE